MSLSVHMGRVAESCLYRSTNLPAAGAVTIMCWYKYTSDSVTVPIAISLVNSAGTAARSFGRNLLASSDTWEFSANTMVELSPQLTTGRWHHVAIACSAVSGATSLLYLDGTLAATDTSAALTPAWLCFGSLAPLATGYWANHQFAAIKIWNRALTATEVIAEIPFALPYNWHGLNSCGPFATAWERLAWGRGFKTASVNPYADWSGNGDRNWTVYGTVDLDIGPPIG